VKDAPTFESLADQIAEFFTLDGEAVDVCGYNVSFDLGFLCQEYNRAGKTAPAYGRIYDPLLLFRKWERRNLSNAVRFYLNEEHEQAHDALADARAALRILMAQKERYGVALEEL
jgi:DNA polymerase III subunit epsilon